MMGSSSDEPKRHFAGHISQKHSISEMCKRPEVTTETLIKLK